MINKNDSFWTDIVLKLKEIKTIGFGYFSLYLQMVNSNKFLNQSSSENW